MWRSWTTWDHNLIVRTLLHVGGTALCKAIDWLYSCTRPHVIGERTVVQHSCSAVQHVILRVMNSQSRSCPAPLRQWHGAQVNHQQAVACALENAVFRLRAAMVAKEAYRRLSWTRSCPEGGLLAHRTQLHDTITLTNLVLRWCVEHKST